MKKGRKTWLTVALAGVLGGLTALTEAGVVPPVIPPLVGAVVRAVLPPVDVHPVVEPKLSVSNSSDSPPLP